MAKSDFKIETVSASKAKTALSRLRSGRGGRTSKYQPILDEVEGSRKGQMVTVHGVPKNGVQALRSFIYRSLDKEEYTVKSAREEDGDTYTVVVGRTDDF